MIKAVGLLSGGLDSTVAAKLLIDIGINVYAINFISPFCTCTPKNASCSSIITAVKQLGNIPLKRVILGDEYLEIVKKPKYGYGKGMNPCIDCRVIKIKKAAQYMREIGAHFLFTGEVVGQRPMSQHRRAIEIIDKESQMAGLILRPLSAQILPPTIPEQKGLVDRKQLLAISGRSRKIQMLIASQKNINDYPCPHGGCLLTDLHFAKRLKDYFMHTQNPSINDIPLLKIGRHFRHENGDKIIVARNEKEGKLLLKLRTDSEIIFNPINFSAPVVLLQGINKNFALQKIIEYTKKEIPKNAIIQVIDKFSDEKFLFYKLMRSHNI